MENIYIYIYKYISTETDKVNEINNIPEAHLYAEHGHFNGLTSSRCSPGTNKADAIWEKYPPIIGL